MTFTTTQKIIQIGSSKGVILPAKELKKIEADVGNEVEVVIRPTRSSAADRDVLRTAQSLLEKYEEDFKNLAER